VDADLEEPDWAGDPGAHPRRQARRQRRQVVVPLCPPGCTSPIPCTWTLSKANIKLIESGGTYVNVHTAKNNLGEIRGQLTRTT
jgi:hypothetical protein